MARLRADLRPPLQVARPVDEPPDFLMKWYVDDWVRDDEDAPTLPNAGDRPMDHTRSYFARALLSRRRFRIARANWLQDLRERGYDPAPLPLAGYPRRRPTTTSETTP